MNEAPAGSAQTERFQEIVNATARLRPLPQLIAAHGSEWVDAPGRASIARRARVNQRLAIALALGLVVAVAGSMVLWLPGLVGPVSPGSAIPSNTSPSPIPSPSPSRPSLSRPSPSYTFPPLPRVDVTGWIAFTTQVAGLDADSDIYLVRAGEAPHRIAGSDTDAVDEQCPAFSPDGRQLAYGRADGVGEAGHTNAAMVIVDIDQAGAATPVREIPVGDGPVPPCPLWSPDGRWLAFAVADVVPGTDGGLVTTVREVRVVQETSGGEVSFPGPASDFDWSPDSGRLAIATASGIVIETIIDRAPLTLPNTAEVGTISWSPDGRFIAFERGFEATVSHTGGAELLLYDLDAGAEIALNQHFDAFHGIGPVWSPTGERLVYQRLCDRLENGNPCREQHDIVVLSAPDVESWASGAFTEAILPQSFLDGDTRVGLAPFGVSWSPDGQNLLDFAFGGAVAVIPVAGDAAPRLLLQRNDLTGYDRGLPVPIQLWGRQP